MKALLPVSRPLPLGLTRLPTGHFRTPTSALNSSELPGLLNEVDAGTVGLLHGGADLAVPHAHWHLWVVMAQLVKSS